VELLEFLDEHRPPAFVAAACGFIAVPDGEGKHLHAYLRQFAEERLSEHDAERLIVLGVEASSPRPLDALVVVEPQVWRLPTPDSASVS
jgi:hypothetical protein